MVVGAIPQEQRALVREKRGCLDALHVDRMISMEAKSCKENLSMAWIDYQKSFNRVPHQWLQDMLKAIKAPKEVCKLNKHVIPKWRTTFTVGNGENSISFQITLQRGIFQGDSLSPLLFCLAIAPLTMSLNKEPGYVSQYLMKPVAHMFFMDDLKVYANDTEGLQAMINRVHQGSAAVGMALGLQKCGTAHMKRGKVLQHRNTDLRGEGEICEINSDRYLGVDQFFSPCSKKVRSKIMQKFYQREDKMWSSNLNGKRKAQATKVWGASLLRYYMTTIYWPITELETIDKKIRGILSKYQAYHK